MGTPYEFVFFRTVRCTKRVKKTVIWLENFRRRDIHLINNPYAHMGGHGLLSLLDIPFRSYCTEIRKRSNRQHAGRINLEYFQHS